MIYSLAIKHQRKIAFVLLYLFYAQFVIAASSFMNRDYEGNSYCHNYGKYGYSNHQAVSVNYNNSRAVNAADIYGLHHNEINEVSSFGTIEKSIDKYAAKKVINKVDVGGPSQPEMQSFQSVNASNMVDLFSGDFSYNIPLMDVGGYPINIFYKSGVSMDQDASWVGLGWNINPGTITRSMRGIPDDFDGKNDTITKSQYIKPNWTFGLNYGNGTKIAGTGLLKGLEVSTGINYALSYNNYKGIDFDLGVNANISTGKKSYGKATGGLSVTNSTRDGVSINPTFSLNLTRKESDTKSGCTGGFSIGFPYNSKTGLKSMQLGIDGGYTKTTKDECSVLPKYNQSSQDGSIPCHISFASPSYTPNITIPFTSQNYNLSFELGKLGTGVINKYQEIGGYYSTQYIAQNDQVTPMPAYGYLNYQNSNNNPASILDYNREKDIPYREKPTIPNIAIPNYTYDIFSISGEGTGGMFRAYRGDVGFVFDHQMTTRDYSGGLGLNIGPGKDNNSIINWGIPLSYTHAYTTNGPWLDQNNLANNIAFQKADSTFEPAYFRNPGEKAINSKSYYQSVGGDDVVAPSLYQENSSSSILSVTSNLNKYNNGNLLGQIPVSSPIYKTQRDKRTQVISYLTAQEASVAGLDKLIQNHPVGSVTLSNCYTVPTPVIGTGNGLTKEYFTNANLHGTSDSIDTSIVFPSAFYGGPDWVSERWSGKIEAPETGVYEFRIWQDDWVLLYINDSLVINTMNKDLGWGSRDFHLNLIKGERLNLRIEIGNHQEGWGGWLQWILPSDTNKTFTSADSIPKKYLYSHPEPDPITYNGLSLEKRVNSFRKQNHISEVDVLNADGRKYVYGIPVYNLYQKEVSFSSSTSSIDKTNNLVGYTPGTDATLGQNTNNEQYYSSEEIPAYAHSFLLTGILSPDYVDITGDGISDDDLGDAVKFNYSKICGINNPLGWRAPYATGEATYSEGLRTDYRDDKGNYVYGQKELWYMHSIESKTMVAIFKLSKRQDALSINEQGTKGDTGYAKKLDEIDLYNKADFLQNGLNAIPVKTVHFEYSYELCRGINLPVNDSGKLTLKKIWFTYSGNNKGALNPYVFTYHANNPSYNSALNDRWGTYKDPLQNPSSTSTNIITNAEYPYALQDSATAAYNAAAWTLVQVQLPSGGRIAVDYESDDYAYVQNKRAMQMCKVAGFAHDTVSTISTSMYSNNFLGTHDNMYVFIRVPVRVLNMHDAYQKYLANIQQMYFKLLVNMPSDKYGSGAEFISNYVNLDTNSGNWYGVRDDSTIWVKIESIDNNGACGQGSYNPLATGAIRYLEQNLASKAYKGSEPGDNMTPLDLVNMTIGFLNNFAFLFFSFDKMAREYCWAQTIDPTRSYARLWSPAYKKYGGGLRVKRVKVYDNWNAMTGGAGVGQIESSYGQEYSYTTTQNVNDTLTQISSGVASYEPILGGEENPFRSAIQYNFSDAALVPTTLGYTEQPLGECFFPAASIGYSKVQVRSIHLKNKRSANGMEETEFYTSYDFPTITDHSDIDNNNKKIYKPWLSNFLHLSAKNYLAMSQGFKVELNDMNGKMKAHSVYAQNDSLLNNPVSYTYNHYRVDNENVSAKHLSNSVMTIDEKGNIDTCGIIGKDIELQADMRSEISETHSPNININADLLQIPIIPPIFLIPLYMNLMQSEKVMNQTAAMVKVINRYGILDSVINIDKGSKISTRNLLYDSETGDVLLTRTQNEFNDPVYNFTYPAHWAYDGMGGAYKNIDLLLQHLTFKNGKITAGLAYSGADTMYFSGGDKLLIASKVSVANFAPCVDSIATFPDSSLIWAVDKSITNGGIKTMYFVDAGGQPFTGNDVSLKIVSSGRKNMGASIGSVTTLANPLIYNSGNYQISLNTTSNVINASAVEYNQLWRVADKNKQATIFANSCQDSSGNSVANPNECSKTSFVANISYGGSRTDEFSDIKEANDGGFIMCGSTSSYGNGNDDGYVVKTDAKGNVQWAKTYGGTNEDYFNTIVPTLDGGYIATGVTRSWSDYNDIYDATLKARQIFLVKMDQNGDIQWTKRGGWLDTLYHRGGEMGNSVLQLSDSGYMLLNNFDDGLSRNKLLFTKMDKSGNVSWNSSFLYSQDDPGQMIEDHDTIIFAFTTDGPLGSYKNGCIAKLAKATGTLMSHMFYTIGGASNWFEGITKVGNNYRVEVSTMNTWKPPIDTLAIRLQVLDIDYQGNVLNATEINRTTNSDTSNSTQALAITNDGGYITAQRSLVDSNIHWRKVDASGNVQAENIVKLSGHQDVNKILALSDGSFIGVGANTGNAMLMKVDTNVLSKCTDSIVHLGDRDMTSYCHTSSANSITTGPISDTGFHFIPLTANSVPLIPVTYLCYHDSCAAKKGVTCTPDSIISSYCYSAVKDTVLNPYFYGVLGNFRPIKSYVYYTKRSESLTMAINTRHNGTFADFSPFWSFAGGANLLPQYDTTKWVWNSAVTLFNEKGLELENKDPLGRYNSGIYGYNNTLPVAVTQNGHYMETGFDGFEDYSFNTNTCNTGCPTPRRWSAAGNYVSNIDSTQSHTGQYSLRIEANSSIGTGVKIVSQDTGQAEIIFNEQTQTCVTGNTLTGIKATSGTLIPSFNLIAGKQVVLSAWVKEDTACSCKTYTHNSMTIVLQGGGSSSSLTAYPKGIIIDGWQRYEQIINIPPNDTMILISLNAIGRNAFFDDIRIHPFNANMKSFVYDPINLRLMAELDENNYATFYEYDDDGTLVRVKKETERGIQTIKETRSALLKTQ